MSAGKARRVQTLIDTAEVKKALGSWESPSGWEDCRFLGVAAGPRPSCDWRVLGRRRRVTAARLGEPDACTLASATYELDEHQLWRWTVRFWRSPDDRLRPYRSDNARSPRRQEPGSGCEQSHERFGRLRDAPGTTGSDDEPSLQMLRWWRRCSAIHGAEHERTRTADLKAARRGTVALGPYPPSSTPALSRRAATRSIVPRRYACESSLPPRLLVVDVAILSVPVIAPLGGL
jgi:hypothetical protein